MFTSIALMAVPTLSHNPGLMTSVALLALFEGTGFSTVQQRPVESVRGRFGFEKFRQVTEVTALPGFQILVAVTLEAVFHHRHKPLPRSLVHWMTTFAGKLLFNMDPVAETSSRIPFLMGKKSKVFFTCMTETAVIGRLYRVTKRARVMLRHRDSGARLGETMALLTSQAKRNNMLLM